MIQATVMHLRTRGYTIKHNDIYKFHCAHVLVVHKIEDASIEDHNTPQQFCLSLV